MKPNKLGIWMDHEQAYLTEFTAEPMKTKIIESGSTHESKKESLNQGENHMHVKDQHLQTEFYKGLGELIRKYNAVVLYGPTTAKQELANALHNNHLFAEIKIEVQQTKKMTIKQMQAFVRKYFSNH